MMRFLKKYRFRITLGILLAILLFWFNPSQEDLYLSTDYAIVEKNSTIAVLWTMGVGAIIVLAIALKRCKKISEIGNILLGMALTAVPVYFVFKAIFISGSLALNRIASPDRFEKKYTTTFLVEADKQTPVIFDFRTGRTVPTDKVGGFEKLEGLNLGDTITISFRKGLLGVPFEPEIK